ncbi:MAG TPA: SpoIIE family protein phosphatase [Leptolyngbyaceae cyanobacterium]
MKIKKLFLTSLRFQLTVVLLAAVIPPMLIGIFFTSYRAEKILREDSKELLNSKGEAIANLVNQWVKQNILALRYLSIQTDITSMEPERQKPILTKVASVYKDVTVTTVAKNGLAVATSDPIEDKNNYRDRLWFKGGISGQAITLQTLISKTTGKPRLCMSAPIKGGTPNQIVGVIVQCKNLTDVAQGVGAVRLGKTGYAMIVDRQGNIIAHPDPKVTTGTLQNIKDYPPVAAFLQGKKGDILFTEPKVNSDLTTANLIASSNYSGTTLAYIVPLENGWGAIVKQGEAEVLREAIEFKQLATGMAGLAVLIVGGITWVLASRLIRPIRDLTVEAKAISSGRLERRVKVDREDELGTLGVAFNCMAGQLQELINDKVKSAMARNELEKGRQIQRDFLPESLPQPEGWEIAACFEPAREVAGDFYDAFPLGDGKVGVLIADVCDKGVGSALFMALFRSLIRAISQQDYANDVEALKNAVEFTNNYIATNHTRTNMFATMFFGVFDPKTGELNYINGGHEPPVILSPDGTKTRLKPTGPAVGMLPNLKFKVQQAKLNPGDILVSYTDGVTEAKSPNAEFFTEKQLMSLLEPPVNSAMSLLEIIQEKLTQHISTADQFDDITLMAVKRTPENL